MTDWNSWNRHIEQVIDDRGYWYGLCDGDGDPLMTLPLPASGTAPEAWMSVQDIQVTIPVDGKHGQHAAAQVLVGDEFTKINADGTLKVAVDGDYLIVVAMRGEAGQIRRYAGIVTHAVIGGDDPVGWSLLTISASNQMDVWHSWPAPSFPLSWWLTEVEEYSTDISGVEYESPRRLSLMEMATAADGYTKFGPVEQIIRVIAQESLDAAASAQVDPDTGVRWVDDPFHVVDMRSSGVESPERYIRIQDETLWDTVSKPAQQNGVVLGCYLWWPGDDPVIVWSQATSDMTGEQVELMPSTRTPYRRLVRKSWEHPMWVLTADQIDTSEV